MKNRANIVILTLALVFAFSALVISVISIIDTDSYNVNDRYTLYIGTSDKDTGTTEIPLDEAKEIVAEIAYKYTDGFTNFVATGGWDDGNVRYNETTLVYIFIGIDRETAELIAAEACVALDQSSVLIEYNKSRSIYLAAD
jgi:hypothetical protein